MDEPSSAESRRSLSRSRSRSRHPSELLARKQQLLSAEANWNSLDINQSDNQDDEPTGSGGGAESRRARALRRPADHQALPESGDSNSSVEAKLENLSELLKSHQHQNESSNMNETSPAKSIDDVYILLSKKEKDLQLAAELGKVLLEKNDELSKANERITEDYSHKLELLEQDKHKLKRKLDLLDSEYENRLIELQTDCNILKNQLEQQQQLARKAEKEKSKLIDDLAQQNQRLTSELVEATKSEELLSSQLEQMNERFNVRLSNRQDHVAQLDALKEEIQIVNQRKQDLERRLKLANNDKNNLSGALEESGDKLLHLENLLNERDAKLAELLDEVNELRDSSSWLSNELESMISMNEKLATSRAEGAALDGEQAAGQRKRSQLIDQLKELRLKNQSRLKANEFMLVSRRQASPGHELGGQVSRPSAAAERRRKLKRRRDTSLLEELETTTQSGSSSPDNDDSSSAADREWREEAAFEVYALLRKFQANLQQRKDALMQSSQAYSATSQQHLYSPNSADDSGISADDLDKANPAEHEQVEDPASWRRLLDSLKLLIEELPCSTCHLMIAERADYEQLQKLHAKLCDEMRRKNDELLALTTANTEQEARLAALDERNAILSDDLSNCDKPKEEIVKLAWQARDQAVERKNAAEISLAKTRIENMQIASQLMEVVQQKGELSQKLAQFEDDIHYITQDSVKAKWELSEKLPRFKAAQPDSTSNSNPLAQLLSFSVVSNNKDSNGKSSAMDSLTQPVSLMRNFTSSAKFNLRFWQRNSTDKAVLPTTVDNQNIKGIESRS